MYNREDLVQALHSFHRKHGRMPGVIKMSPEYSAEYEAECANTSESTHLQVRPSIPVILDVDLKEGFQLGVE